MTARLDRARRAFERKAWGEAYRLLTVTAPVDADDLERLAVAAHLTGHDDESADAWERACNSRAGRGDKDGAARCAMWLATALMLRGDIARAGGWFARATRLAEDADECAVSGYLKLPEFLQLLGAGQAQIALATAEEMARTGTRFDDPDLLAFGTLACGQARLALGEARTGMALLDEAMVAVTSGEVSPIVAGIVYCAVIEACMDVMDLRRAGEWTAALSDWCAAQPDLVPYRGQCLVHRSQVLQAHGEWAEALTEAERARQRLTEPEHPALGLALYQQGELHRLRGEVGAAEQAYRAASRHGREPAPGLALLRLQEGKPDAAVAAVRRMLDESRGQLNHPLMLAATAEIMLATGDHAGARRAADELVDAAGQIDLPTLRAVAAFVDGAVLVAENQPSRALTSLRAAGSMFRDVHMPYENARVRVQIALACRQLGDHDAAELELEAAKITFQELGAVPDLTRTAALTDGGSPRPAGLTERECEVLRLVAKGATNRDIASTLVISEHTVARHVQNIFVKLGLSSRAAATAYAYEHHLV